MLYYLPLIYLKDYSEKKNIGWPGWIVIFRPLLALRDS